MARPSVVLQVATVSERSRIMELEREVADLQLRLRASQQKEDAASLSQQQISCLKAQAQTREKKVGPPCYALLLTGTAGFTTVTFSTLIKKQHSPLQANRCAIVLPYRCMFVNATVIIHNI